MNNLPVEISLKLDDILLQWQKLYTDVVENESFNYELFKDTFIKTYRIVHPLSHQLTIHKDYIKVLSIAKEFEATWIITVNDEHDAACWLTHELLQDCFILFYPENETPVMLDSKDNEYSYEDVDTLIYLIKNQL